MNTIHRTAIVPYSDRQMFELINDVDDYKNFLPWCGDSKVIEDQQNTRIASVTIALKGIHKTFTTRNHLTPYQKITLEMIDGPFSELSGTWQFKSLNDQGCKISLNLHFGFSNRLLAAVIEPAFKIIANNMLDSFVKRAQTLYDTQD